MNIEFAMAKYMEIYQSLYKRAPQELRDLGGNWVIVNGARMTLEELRQLTDQLQAELHQEKMRKKTLVKRLLSWFGGDSARMG